MRFLTFGRSLWVTGFVVASPHLIARTNAEDTMPAMFRTVFGFIARGVLVLRVWPPHFSNRVHSRLRCSGVISVMFIASSSGAMYAAISRYRSTVFGARFSSACCFMNSARSIARVVGIGAATPPVAACATSSSARRTPRRPSPPASLRIQIP